MATDLNPSLARMTEASGLAPVIARGVLARCCARIGVDPAQATLRDLERLLPHMEPLLRLYLRGDEAEQHVAALRALAKE